MSLLIRVSVLVQQRELVRNWEEISMGFEINKTFYKRAKEEMLIKPDEVNHQMDFMECLEAAEGAV